MLDGHKFNVHFPADPGVYCSVFKLGVGELAAFPVGELLRLGNPYTQNNGTHLPVAVIWPVIFRIIRFYRRAYLSEQLNPMTPDQAAPAASKAPEKPEKPEVLGTVISAPVTAQTPADITRKNQPAAKTGETEEIRAGKAEEKPEIKEGRTPKRVGVRAPVRPVHVGVEAPQKEKVEALGSGPAKEEAKPDEVIYMGSPKPKSDEAIPMPAPKPRSDEAIPMPAPKPSPDKPIHLGAPSSDKGKEQ